MSPVGAGRLYAPPPRGETHMIAHLTLATAVLLLGSDPQEKDPTKVGPEHNKENVEKLLQAVKQGNDCKVSIVLRAGVEEPYPIPHLGRDGYESEMSGEPGFVITSNGPRGTPIKGDGPGTATFKYTFRNGPKGKEFTVVVDLVFINPDKPDQ